ncbi:Hypothetical protein CINCED_3A005807 [Cinara cedri]|uniref:Uncharacterized protein n=1 Tax=Cinara cedri TaxID=506608 RepID=A0A5E4M8F6_9HEMI|nr:Hypothetical protein CINCED_3A005807 [Cinara cedri]
MEMKKRERTRDRRRATVVVFGLAGTTIQKTLVERAPGVARHRESERRVAATRRRRRCAPPVVAVGRRRGHNGRRRRRVRVPAGSMCAPYAAPSPVRATESADRRRRFTPATPTPVTAPARPPSASPPPTDRAVWRIACATPRRVSIALSTPVCRTTAAADAAPPPRRRRRHRRDRVVSLFAVVVVVVDAVPSPPPPPRYCTYSHFALTPHTVYIYRRGVRSPCVVCVQLFRAAVSCQNIIPAVNAVRKTEKIITKILTVSPTKNTTHRSAIGLAGCRRLSRVVFPENRGDIPRGFTLVYSAHSTTAREREKERRITKEKKKTLAKSSKTDRAEHRAWTADVNLF